MTDLGPVDPLHRFVLEMLVGDTWRPIASSAAWPTAFLKRAHPSPWRCVDSVTGEIRRGRQRRASVEHRR
ncbi:hypothetical protein BH11PLA2_BH11PLA2_43970 [soil metagenome]